MGDLSMDENLYLIFMNKDEGENFALDKPFHCDEWIVPSGFLTDAASIPKIARIFINKWGKHARAAILHDYMYTTHCVDRKKADQLFLSNMLRIGVNKLKAYAMYYAVRWFGNGPWKKGYKNS